MSHCPPSSGEPGPHHTADLSAAEAFVVTVLRLWAAPYRQPDQPHPDWRLGFAAAGAEDGCASFDALFLSVVARATRPLDVRCPRCPHLGEDELAFLRMVQLLQDHRWSRAETMLADWLPAEATSPALAQATLFATAIAAAGLVLPHRADERAREAEVIPFPRAWIESTAVH